MPEVTPTPYPTLNAWIPYPTATPFVSIIPTPILPGTAGVRSVEISASGTWLFIAMALGLISAAFRLIIRGKQ